MTKTTGLVALKTQYFLAVVKLEKCFRLSANSKNTFSFNTKREDCKIYCKILVYKFGFGFWVFGLYLD